MLAIVIRSVNAPKSRGGKYRRPVRVCVVDTRLQDPTKPLRKGILWERRNVDSRYDGPNAAYGKALRRARAIVKAHEELTALLT